MNLTPCDRLRSAGAAGGVRAASTAGGAQLMAVVKLKYLRERPQLKRHLRYITHRRGREEGKVTRQLFNVQGLTDRASVYGLIDAAARGTVFYKFMINLGLRSPRRPLSATQNNRRISQTSISSIS